MHHILENTCLAPLCKQHLSLLDPLLVLQVCPGPSFLFAILQAWLLPGLFPKFTVTCFVKSPLQICLCETAVWQGADKRSAGNTLSESQRCSRKFTLPITFILTLLFAIISPWCTSSRGSDGKRSEAGTTPSGLSSHSSKRNRTHGFADTAWCHCH